ncbi:hypothetical protein AB0M43_29630 [Longispora sp. NPDC051575]|uniref:hypothetical protein n=1 Tax=Longispora sp. NPDC051575 TaxID=3154943 RepID=UPI0034278E2E
MAKAFRVDLPTLLKLRYPDPQRYLAELIRHSVTRNAKRIRIVPADVNRGQFQISDDGETTVPDGRLPGEDGLVAGLLVSDSVTRTSAGTKWVGRISGTHTTTAVEDDLTGTTVTLRRRRGETLLNTSKVVELARRFAEMSPIPVDVAMPGGATQNVNRQPPWLLDKPLEIAEYGAELLDADPLDMVALKKPTGETFGVAYILPTSPAPRAVQKHALYRDGLLLEDDGADLLPEWAFFARCVLDAGALPADRAEARTQLGQTLRSWLLLLSARQPRRLTQFVNTHHLALKIHAAQDPELARIITRWLPFETSAGRLTLTELLGRTRHVRYATTRDVFRQLAPIAGRNTPFVNAGHLHDVKLLEQLPELYDDVTVERVEVSDIMADLDDPPLSDRVAQLRLRKVADSALAATGCATVVKSFEPASLPVLYLGDPATLCLNHRSPIIQHLARLSDQTVLSRTVQLLHAQARLHGHLPLRGVDTELLSGALLDLVQLAALEEDLSGLDHG